MMGDGHMDLSRLTHTHTHTTGERSRTRVLKVFSNLGCDVYKERRVALANLSTATQSGEK